MSAAAITLSHGVVPMSLGTLPNGPYLAGTLIGALVRQHDAHTDGPHIQSLPFPSDSSAPSFQPNSLLTIPRPRAPGFPPGAWHFWMENSAFTYDGVGRAHCTLQRYQSLYPSTRSSLVIQQTCTYPNRMHDSDASHFTTSHQTHTKTFGVYSSGTGRIPLLWMGHISERHQYSLTAEQSLLSLYGISLQGGLRHPYGALCGDRVPFYAKVTNLYHLRSSKGRDSTSAQSRMTVPIAVEISKSHISSSNLYIAALEH
ncbi:uncharacterized protein EI90DRAFT_181515 [Cantharellus anzutake]|uniref:uncharacterized protein n=1 Tax=Cantharellus anzutake TaxID=1750568 RepID=UPI001904C941|nr:uncharacterized protein EI90DRAFT_181515 [Cantharellus anzutake]KAF8336491.1 hypothetical protein EI90DRAFT_181515 [Cantharellus anzutake]